MCRVGKQNKNNYCWKLVRHEIDDPCLKSIMVSKPEIHLWQYLSHTHDWSDFIMQ